MPTHPRPWSSVWQTCLLEKQHPESLRRSQVARASNGSQRHRGHCEIDVNPRHYVPPVCGGSAFLPSGAYPHGYAYPWARKETPFLLRRFPSCISMPSLDTVRPLAIPNRLPQTMPNSIEIAGLVMPYCYAYGQCERIYDVSGWGGIRTPGAFRHTRFPGVHNQPLCHPSMKET